MKEVSVDELRRRLEAGEDLVVLDVREPDEVASSAIPGSVNIPLGEVADRMGELDASRPTAVICAGGVRSAKAVTALTAAGYTGELVNVSGGMKAWLGQSPGGQPLGTASDSPVRGRPASFNVVLVNA